ncbi:MAG TPA: response regulator transcription factor [Verrucomicrobiae bacterium]|nr:response regulator transcription factor [Verrucomicrobiae bacterium]
MSELQGGKLNSDISRSAVAERNTNVWIIDNDPFFRQKVALTISGAPGLILSGCFVHPEDALDCRGDLEPPDIILIDLEQFGHEGLDAIQRLSDCFPGTPWLILTNSAQENCILNGIRAGACGYLLKTSPLNKVPECIRDTIEGGAWLEPSVARALLNLLRRASSGSRETRLTVRELRILDLMGQGMVLKQIAEELKISHHTVDTHSRNIYAKLGVHSRAGAVAKALRARII